MKLSMHMIANRIYFLDMELNLSDSDPPVLKSARLVSVSYTHLGYPGVDQKAHRIQSDMRSTCWER